MDTIMIVLYAYAFVVGICVASFINVVIWRVPQGISIAKGRSYCPSCGKQLVWKDLLPVFSYLFLKGKCRYCKGDIPKRDTLIEFFGGLIAMFCLYQYQFSLDTIIVFSIFMILLAISVIDMDTMIIPNGLVVSFAICTLFLINFHPEITIVSRMIGFIIISLPMYLLTRFIPDCFGGGDIKLIAVAGILLGWQNTVLATFIAIMIAGSYAIYLLANKRTKKDAHIAFGPYLCIGIVLAHLYGVSIITFYLSLFNL